MASSSHGHAASRKHSLDSGGSPLAASRKHSLDSGGSPLAASRKRSLDSAEGSPLAASRKRPLIPAQVPLALTVEERLALPAPKRSAVRRRYDYMDSAESVELKVLLPDGGHVILHEESDDELRVEELLRRIKRKVAKDGVSCSVQWGPHVYLEDAAGNRIQDGQIFKSDEHDRTLILQDGQPHGTHSLQDMWNVTPDPELLNTLPQEYTLETALADLLDNSLQAVWANAPGERRLISVTLSKDKITIFDSGQGMDSTSENSIAKWGTMGSSKHRAVRFSAVGGRPPFLRPFFGMYGFGGLIAAMHLGGVAVVSSKTKSSNKVVSLTLEKDNLMETSRVERTWKTPGEYREPTKEELRIAPHGSFTKVELSKLKEKAWTEGHVKCMLKDIYFPYIQCDEADSSQRTTTPVEFQVNGTNLAEVYGGEVATTNMYSSNGAPFVIDIHLKKNGQNIDPDMINEFDRANARIKCLYFPIQQGKESIDHILKELHKEEVGIHETFDNFCRVAIRRLGRLLPDARWGRLPFMESKRKRADKATVPKVCFERVKAFVDTDAGFVPTTSKMDLLTGHAFTTLLKNLGTRGNMPEDVTLEIFRETRKLKLQDMEKEYQEWIKEMHELFDEEVECEDQPYIIITGQLKELGFSQEVYRVYVRMNRKGSLWKRGTRLKFKGLPGHKKDFYATLEYFLADGLSEDKGNTKVVCRPMETAKEDGSCLILVEEISKFEMRKSVAIPIEFLTPDKCETLHESEWKRICDNKHLHCPGEIEVLDRKILRGLNLDGGISSIVKAGIKPFNYIYAVIRPNSYIKSVQEGKELNPVDQRNIVKKPMQMILELRNLNSSDDRDEDSSLTDISMVVNEKSVNNIQGFYCFGIENGNFGRFYTKAGKYALTLSVMDEGNSEVMLEKTLEVTVLPSDNFGKWILQTADGSGIPVCRLGSQIGPLLLQCLDEYGNVKNVDVTEDLRFEVWSGQRKLQIDLLVVKDTSQQNTTRTSFFIEAIKLTGGLLTGIAMDHVALLKLVVHSRPVGSLELKVLPGEMALIMVLNHDNIDNCLKTGDVIHSLTLQVMDGYGNPIEMGRKVVLQLDNVELQDNQGLDRMVDDKGCIFLGGLLKVTGPFNSRAAICVYSENQKLLYRKEFSLLKRTLQIVSTIPQSCAAGGMLHDVMIQIVDENGNVDWTMTGGQHFIVLTHVEQHLYPMKEGTCHIKEIQLPDEPGPWFCHINHMMSKELEAQIEIELVPSCGHFFDAPDTPVDNEKTSKLMLPDKSGVRKDLKRLLHSLITHSEELKKKMGIYVNKLKKAEDELEKLIGTKKAKMDKISAIEGEIASLQSQAQNIQHSSMIDGQDKNDISPESIAQAIFKTSFPTKFFLEAFCEGSFLSAEAGHPYIADILGVVCLLASTKDAAMSQAIAEFVGLESMIAVVCKTKEAARLLVRLNSDGTIDETWGLYKFIRNQSRNMHGKLRLFILQDMRCYCEVQNESNPQKLLNMEAPKLNGAVPKGFKGYAVNLLHLNKEHLDFKVSGADHGGLRGSLFYSLLKELQVYDTRKNLLSARDVLTTGGISLDGGLIRERGCEDFGTREEAKITFPLYSKSREEIPPLHSMVNLSQSVQIINSLKGKRQEFQECKAQLVEIDERMKFVKKQIKAREEKCSRVSEEMVAQKKEIAQLEENLRGM